MTMTTTKTRSMIAAMTIIVGLFSLVISHGNQRESLGPGRSTLRARR